MKYKVGDKVKVRSDLNYGKYSEGVPFTSEMDKFKGTVLEVRKIAGEFYEMVGIPYIFTDEMLEPVEEMSAEEAIRLQGEICMSLMCRECPIDKLRGDSHLECVEFRAKHPEEIVKILKQWKADHKKKPIETEFIYIVRIIEGKQCVHEEEMVEESEDEAQERVLKKYCEDHEGKFYAVAERICRVKE